MYTIDFFAGTKPTFTVQNGEVNGARTVNSINILEARTDKNCFYVYGDYTFRFAGGLSFTVVNSAGNNNTYTVTSSQYVGNATIVTSTPGTPSIAIAGDFTNSFTVGRRFSIASSTHNDGRWIVASSSYSAPNTTIVLSNTVPAGYKVGSTISSSGTLGIVRLAMTAIKINGTPNVGANTTNDGQVNYIHPTPGTTLELPGQGTSVWGEIVIENLVHLLENFSGGSSPTFQTTGQLWYDTGTATMKVWNGSVWTSLLSGAIGVTDLTVSSSLSSNGATTIGDAAGDPFTINSATITWAGNPTHTGNHIFNGNVTVKGNTQIGDAGGDTLTVFPSAITWSNNPTHSGNHTFSGNVVISSGSLSTGNSTSWSIATTGGTQLTITNTASANRTVSITGSNGGNPSVGTTAGAMSLKIAGTEVARVADDINDFTSFYRKNIVIGGDFSINPWQRGTSFTAVNDGDYTADRFFYRKSSAAVNNVTQAADGPSVAQTGFLVTNSLSVATTTIDGSVGAGDFVYMSTRVEGSNFIPLAQNAMAFSFWHKHTKTGTYCVAFQNSGQDRSYVAEYTQAVTNTWEYATVIIPASPSAGTWNYTNGTGIQVIFTLMGGATFQASAGSWQTGNFVCSSNQVNAVDNVVNVFRIALVQLEKGNVSTPFEQRPSTLETFLSRRYTQVFAGTGFLGFGQCTATTSAQVGFSLTPPMRTAPTGVTVSSPSHFEVLGSAAGTNAVTALVFSSSTNTGLSMTASVASGLAAGDATTFRSTNSSSSLLVSTEL